MKLAIGIIAAIFMLFTTVLTVEARTARVVDIDGHVMVAAVDVYQWLDVYVRIEQNDITVMGDTFVFMTVGSTTAFTWQGAGYEKEEIEMAIHPQMSRSVLYIPLDYVAESIRLTVVREGGNIQLVPIVEPTPTPLPTPTLTALTQRITQNGISLEWHHIDGVVIEYDDLYFVPLGSILELFSTTGHWRNHGSNEEFQFRFERVDYALRMESNRLYTQPHFLTSRRRETLDWMPKLIDNEIYVMASWVAGIFDIDLHWNSEAEQIYVATITGDRRIISMPLPALSPAPTQTPTPTPPARMGRGTHPVGYEFNYRGNILTYQGNGRWVNLNPPEEPNWSDRDIVRHLTGGSDWIGVTVTRNSNRQIQLETLAVTTNHVRRNSATSFDVHYSLIRTVGIRFDLALRKRTALGLPTEIVREVTVR
ncbi:MAG: hypothetical protein FWB87_04315 [Defluviitaleaceae bacterium]|nr:hypothetical protein [Defluviitaleaceae bacterium]